MSSFAQTCNLLRQYLKERRSIARIEPKQQEMTIFYAPQVMVFDHLPSERAEEVMAMAMAANAIPEPIKASGDLPIARRASLHRFLEKRKDRAAVRAPYQLHYAASSSKPAAHNGNQQSSNQFDLNL